MQDAGTNISPELKSQAEQACKNTLDDIEDNFDATMAYPYLKAVDVAFNTDQNNIQEYLEESGLLAFKNSLKQLLAEYKNKFANGTITASEIKNYTKLTNEYFAAKKEILIAAQALQDMKSDNNSIRERTIQVTKSALK